MSNSSISLLKQIELYLAEESKRHRTIPDVLFDYGTAGFRANASTLDSVMFRVGLLAALRSKACHGEGVGVMITASHNPEEDNGVKIVDPTGNMLEESWEQYATLLANATQDQLFDKLNWIVEKCEIELHYPALIFIATDTRPSSQQLKQAVADGVSVLSGKMMDFGLLTTPQLHYMTKLSFDKLHVTEQVYYKKFGNAFIKLMADRKRYEPFKIDAANGVGALKMKSFSEQILGNAFPVNIMNDGSSGKLNDKCGADYVKTNQCPPDNMEIFPGDRCVSFDGDADRIVFYTMLDDNSFIMMDGDKIAVLAAIVIKQLVDDADLDLKLGVVQTAYANGNSTRYIQENLQVPLVFTKTGVKHLHAKAIEFDIGVYFEANGHGTVLFSENAKLSISRKAVESGNKKEKEAAMILKELTILLNQSVGDAISDLLFVEFALTYKQWDFIKWHNMYHDIPNRLMKVTVKNRGLFKTAKADMELVEPAGLQEMIDVEVEKVSLGRAFVRPSGTEDVVRVYAEAETKSKADALAGTVSRLVYDHGHGVGKRP